MTEQEEEMDLLLAGLADGDQFLPEQVARIDDLVCGCGEPWRVWDWVGERLNDIAKENWNEPASGAEWLAVYLLDRKGYTEHGGSLPWCWLTDDGLILLGFLCRNGSNWSDHKHWIGADGITRGSV